MDSVSGKSAGSGRSTGSGKSAEAGKSAAADRKSVLLRLDPAVHAALTRWANDELRSVNAQMEKVLRDALREYGRLPATLSPPRGRGRPPKEPPPVGDTGS